MSVFFTWFSIFLGFSLASVDGLDITFGQILAIYVVARVMFFLIGWLRRRAARISWEHEAALTTAYSGGEPADAWVDEQIAAERRQNFRRRQELEAARRMMRGNDLERQTVNGRPLEVEEGVEVVQGVVED